MIKIFDIIFETCNVLLLCLDGFFNELDTFNRLLEPFKVVYLALNPLNDLIVWIAKLLRQTIHHVFKLMIWMR